MFKKTNYITKHWFNYTIDNLSLRLSSLENRENLTERRLTETIISILVDSGILIEDGKASNGYITRDGKTYKVKKVK